MIIDVFRTTYNLCSEEEKHTQLTDASCSSEESDVDYVEDHDGSDTTNDESLTDVADSDDSEVSCEPLQYSLEPITSYQMYRLNLNPEELANFETQLRESAKRRDSEWANSSKEHINLLSDNDVNCRPYYMDSEHMSDIRTIFSYRGTPGNKTNMTIGTMSTVESAPGDGHENTDDEMLDAVNDLVSVSSAYNDIDTDSSTQIEDEYESTTTYSDYDTDTSTHEQDEIESNATPTYIDLDENTLSHELDQIESNDDDDVDSEPIDQEVAAFLAQSAQFRKDRGNYPY